MSLQVHCEHCDKSLFNAHTERAIAESRSFVLYTQSSGERFGPWDGGRRDFCNEECAGWFFLGRVKVDDS